MYVRLVTPSAWRNRPQLALELRLVALQLLRELQEASRLAGDVLPPGAVVATTEEQPYSAEMEARCAKVMLAIGGELPRADMPPPSPDPVVIITVLPPSFDPPG